MSDSKKVSIETFVPDCPLRARAQKLYQLASRFPDTAVIERSIVHSEDMIEAGAGCLAYYQLNGFWPDITAFQKRKHVEQGLALAKQKQRCRPYRIASVKVRKDIADITSVQRRLTTVADGVSGGYIDGLSDQARRDQYELRKREGKGKPKVQFVRPKTREASNTTKFSYGLNLLKSL